MGETIATLSASGALSTPAPQGFDVPGDAAAQAALGYLHGNCSGCHNPSLRMLTAFSMKLHTADSMVELSDTYVEAVGAVSMATYGPMLVTRIFAGDPAQSVLVHRMIDRTDPAIQMPPFATETADAVAIQQVSDWILSLP